MSEPGCRCGTGLQSSQHTVREGDAVDAAEIGTLHTAYEQQQPLTPAEHEQKLSKKMNNGLMMMMMQQHLVGVQPSQQTDHMAMMTQQLSQQQGNQREDSQQQGRRFIGQYELLETLGKGMSGK